MISGTSIAYLHLCHRKLWLSANGIRMENATANAYVEEGKLISENTYTRRADKWRELNLGHLKIDHYDPVSKIVREVKKSNKLEHAHVAQVKYYLYAMQQLGIAGATGLIEYPRQRKTTTVELSHEDVADIKGWEQEVRRISQLPNCPELVRKTYCKSCAFYDFCYT
jgi:CRISPR-associated exonuclease Cas4